MLEADSQITQELFKVPSFALNIMPVDKHICMHHFVSKGMEGSKLCCCGPLKTLIHPARLSLRYPRRVFLNYRPVCSEVFPLAQDSYCPSDRYTLWFSVTKIQAS